MYATFFGLKEMPFNLTPDSRYLFLSRRHREALNYLLYGIHEKKGFIVLTGGIGTGKTTICRALLAHLDDTVDTALIFNSFMSELEILETAAREFGIAPLPQERKTIRGYIEALNEFLLADFAAGRTALLVIDEAQNLSLSALEQIRMISNLETEREKLVQIVLIGQPELKKKLAAPELRQLNERITVRYDLGPLDRADVREYILHRMTVAGSNGILRFTAGAHRCIYNFSRGIPRRINAICDRALLIAYTGNKAEIKPGTIRRAIADLHGMSSRFQSSRIWRKWIVPTAAFLAAASAGAFLAGIHYADLLAKFRTYLTW